MKKIIPILCSILIVFSFSVAAGTEITEKGFFKIVYTFPGKNIKKITIEPGFENAEVTPYSKHLQKVKVERNRRLSVREPKKVYIPDDCNKDFWQKHHRLHYCDNFKIGGKPWKDPEIFVRRYK